MKRVPLKGYTTADHVTDAVGLDPAVLISKNGAGFANPSAGATVASEVSDGWYYVDLSAVDTGTLGPLIVRATHAGMDASEIAYEVAVLGVPQTGDCFPSVATAAAYAVMTSGVAFRGAIASIPAPNQFIVTAFIGFGAGAFADATAPYRVFVFRDDGGLSGAPQGETQTVTAYNTATGQINHTAFSVPLVAGDQVILMHPRIAELAAIKADTAAILLDTAEIGAAGAGLTAVRLAAAGLDAISIVAPAGPAANFREMLVQTWRRLFKRATMTATAIRTYADDDTTVVTTQVVSDDGLVQVQGQAT